MSEEENNNSGSAATQPESTQEEPKVVPAKAFEEVTRDMHKNKQKAKELAAEVNQLRTQLKAQEELKMQENDQWKEIAARREAELEDLRKESEQKSSRFQSAVKRSALKQELGGKIKEEYLSFADLSQVRMDENGIVDMESLRNVANEFRKQHGQLIPQTPEQEITGHASTVNEISSVVDIKKMTSQQLVEHYAKLKKTN